MFELDELLAEPPGSDVVAALASLDRAALSPDDGVTVAIIADRAMSWLSSLQDEAILAAGSGHTQVQELLVLDPRPDRFGETRLRIEDVIREEIAAATRWSLNHAHDRLVRARLLAAGLPRTRQAQAAGRISPAHVQALVQQARRLPFAAEVLAGGATGAQRAAFTHACEEFEKRVLPAAERGTVAQARTAARRAVLAIDGEGEARRRQQVKAIRDAFVLAEDDGLSALRGADGHRAGVRLPRRRRRPRPRRPPRERLRRHHRRTSRAGRRRPHPERHDRVGPERPAVTSVIPWAGEVPQPRCAPTWTSPSTSPPSSTCAPPCERGRGDAPRAAQR